MIAYRVTLEFEISFEQSVIKINKYISILYYLMSLLRYNIVAISH